MGGVCPEESKLVVKITRHNDTLRVSDITQLAAVNAGFFEREVRRALSHAAHSIDIDLSQTDFVDCRGIGALIALRKSARLWNHQAIVRLLNPATATCKLLKLTQLDSLFSIQTY